MNSPDKLKYPNILLISIDSLRADHLSLYGYEKETSPYLTELSFDGVVYENAFSAANWTGASIASILTGLYPACHGYTNKHYYLDNGQDSLAAILQGNGYFTICFSNNMYLGEQTGLHVGFDEFRYRGQLQQTGTKPPARSRNGLIECLKKLPSASTKNITRNISDVLYHSRALMRDDGACETETAFQKWIYHYDRVKPFFAYIHYQEPHSIYFPPYPFRRRFFSGSWFEEAAYLQFDHMRYFAGKINYTETQVRHYLELYDAEITYLDWRLGRLFATLKKQHLFENTAIIVTADHGEMFGENEYFWHAFCLYEPLIRVPLLIRFPEWFERDCRSLNIVQSNDIVPTLLDGLNLEWKHHSQKQGQSFLHGSRRQAALTETFNPEFMIDRWLQRNEKLNKKDFAHYLRDLTAYRKQDGKLIYASDGKHEFYDIKYDPSESHNIYSKKDIRIKNYENELKDWIGSFTPHTVSEDTQPGFDKATWEKMKALGYA
ncbi:DUF229 domain-containing protein [candidate division KSB1 bacterium]|nr:sulfatase [candidate division KSB1 bacterium]RQW04163.1 MAG: DUF229 domain-containing protein [candidate division KSB1 bacterium]